MSCVHEKTFFWVSDLFRHKPGCIEPQKMAIGLTFRINEGGILQCSQNKGAKSRFSHNAAHIIEQNLVFVTSILFVLC